MLAWNAASYPPPGSAVIAGLVPAFMPSSRLLAGARPAGRPQEFRIGLERNVITAAFIAYVPPGSIARGEALVKGGESGKTVQCALCHGEALKGLGEVPRLAGLQPLYVARQLFDMRYGSSAGKLRR